VADVLTKLFADVLNTSEAELNDQSSPDNVENWESLSAMHLVAAIEEQFAVKLSTREIMKMATIGLARETLRKKGIDI